MSTESKKKVVPDASTNGLKPVSMSSSFSPKKAEKGEKKKESVDNDLYFIINNSLNYPDVPYCHNDHNPGHHHHCDTSSSHNHTSSSHDFGGHGGCDSHSCGGGGCGGGGCGGD